MNVSRIIFIIHLLLTLSIILIPFIDVCVYDCEKYVTYIFVILAAIMIHWITNDNTCFLTILESRLTDKDKSETFVGKLVDPIYKLPDNFTWIITIIIFIFVTILLRNKYSFSFFKKCLSFNKLTL